MDTKDNPFRRPETREDGPDQVTYYYNRDRRLANATDNARFTVSKWDMKRPGLVKGLMATGSLRLLFLMLILFVLLGFLLDMIVGNRHKAQLAGYSVRLQAMYFEGEVYVHFSRQERNSRTVPSSFELLVSAGDEAVSGLLSAGSNDFRVKLPAAEKPAWVAALVRHGEQQLELAAKVD